MDFKRSWNLLNIYDLIIIALLILTIYNIQRFPEFLLPVISIVAASVLLDLAINFAKKRKFFFPKSALITGLILATVIEGGLLFLLLVAAIAILSKHLIRIKGRHIFNPANFALFAALLAAPFLPVSQSWWGTSNYILAGIMGLVIVYKLRRFHLVLPFLAVHAAAMAVLLMSPDQLASHVISGALLFFAFYMLVEPITSPIRRNSRIIFGVLAGLFAALLYVVWLPAMLIGALFFADLLVPLINRLSQNPKQPSPELPPDSPPTNPNW